jgi:hypothetical protein
MIVVWCDGTPISTHQDSMSDLTSSGREREAEPEGDSNPSGDRPLTPRQQRFVEEYLIDLNATQAAIRAGYSPRTARQTSAEIMAKPATQDAVAAAQRARSERTEITQDWVLRGLAAEATRLDKRGSASARVAAYRLLGQHVGLFQDRPLDILLALLPAELAIPLREALARYVAEGGQLPHGGKAGG